MSNLKRRGINIIDGVNTGMRKAFPGYSYIRMFQPSAWSYNINRRDMLDSVDGDNNTSFEYQALRKFFRRYPEIKQMSVLGPLQQTEGGGFK